MPKKLGVYADVSNLYYCLRKKYGRRNLNYKAMLAYLQDIGESVFLRAYGAQRKTEAVGFMVALQSMGFATNFIKPDEYGDKLKADQDIAIAVDIFRDMDQLDTVVVASADGDLAPLVKFCRERSKEVIILGCGISKHLYSSGARCIEIPESLLEGYKR